MLKLIEKSISTLQDARLRENKVLLGLSGGKDSLASLDLCLKVYDKKKHIPFFYGIYT